MPSSSSSCRSSMIGSALRKSKERDYSNLPHEYVELEPLAGREISTIASAAKENCSSTSRNNHRHASSPLRANVLVEEDASVSSSASTNTQLFRRQNVAIPFCYLTVGRCQGRHSTKYYHLNLLGNWERGLTLKKYCPTVLLMSAFHQACMALS